MNPAFLAEIAHSINPADVVIIYGPLGVGWIGMAWFINKLIKIQTARENKAAAREEARDRLHREMMHEQAVAYQAVAHKLSGFARAMIYQAAAFGEETLKQMAKAELERMGANSMADRT